MAERSRGRGVVICAIERCVIDGNAVFRSVSREARVGLINIVFDNVFNGV